MCLGTPTFPLLSGTHSFNLLKENMNESLNWPYVGTDLKKK